MKRYYVSSASDRFSAMVILLVVTIVAVGSVLGIKYLYDYGFYKDNGQTARESVLRVKTQTNVKEIEEYLYASLNSDNDSDNESNYGATVKMYEKKYAEGMSNVFFTVKDSFGNVILQNYDMVPYQYKYSTSYSMNLNSGELAEGLIECYVREEFNANDSMSLAFFWVSFASFIRFPIFAILIFAILLILSMLSIISYGAGNIRKNGKVSMGFIDRVPLDLCALFTLIFLFLAYLCISLTQIADVGMVVFNVVVMFVTIIAMILLLTFLSTLSVRIKLGNPLNNTLIYRLHAVIALKAPGLITKREKKLSYFSKLLLIVGIFSLVELITIAYFAYRDFVLNDIRFLYYILFWVISRILIIPIVVVIALNLHYIQEEGERIASGDLENRVSSRYMFKGFRSYTENLDQIRNEISKSIEMDIENERLKNDMITNLSHDIKTPLTSIINYVDILKNKESSPEERAEYIDVIDRQSEKLKKLLENILESSRVSTGSIKVELSSMDVGLLLSQSAAEFQPLLSENKLELVYTEPEEEILILADSNLIWRTIENLMNNICKYSMESTRVYVNVQPKESKVKITFKNIAKYALDTDGKELFERFFRGDSSRHTDGNGLGLSIARKLTEMQEGSMDLSVDGDLFKVELVFKRMYE